MSTGSLPASIGPLDAEQLSRLATTQSFLDFGFDSLSANDVDGHVSEACSSGDQVARAALYRAIQRRNGHLGEQGVAWLHQLANGSPGQAAQQVGSPTRPKPGVL